ncbi:MAG: hypothetical protein ACKPA9_09220 [Microcystis sp.]
MSGLNPAKKPVLTGVDFIVMDNNLESFDNEFVYLLIKLEQNSSKTEKNESEKFTVSGWLVMPKRSLQKCKSEDDYFREPLSKTYESNRSYTKVEIEDKISELITECNDSIRKLKLNRHPKISIEWILPEKLLSSPVDCWEYRKGKKIGCGSYYSVHVRSSQRLQSAYDHVREDWEERWTLLINYSHDSKPEHYILTCDCHDKDDDDLQNINDETKIFGINCVSDLCEGKNITYDFIIETGIPVALWSRCKDPNVNHLKDLDNLTSCKNNQSWNLTTLVESIKILRRSAKKDNVHLGNNLCFLWENPYNYPITDKFKMSNC